MRLVLIRMCECRVELQSRIEAQLLLCMEDCDDAKLKYVQEKLKDEVIGMARLDMYVQRWCKGMFSAAGKGAAPQAAAKEDKHWPGATRKDANNPKSQETRVKRDVIKCHTWQGQRRGYSVGKGMRLSESARKLMDEYECSPSMVYTMVGRRSECFSESKEQVKRHSQMLTGTKGWQ